MRYSDEELRRQRLLDSCNNLCEKCGRTHRLEGYGTQWQPQERVPGGRWVIGNLEVVCVNCRRLPGDDGFGNPVDQDFGAFTNFIAGVFGMDQTPGPVYPPPRSVRSEDRSINNSRRSQQQHLPPGSNSPDSRRSQRQQRPAGSNSRGYRRQAVIGALETAARALGPIAADYLQQAGIHLCKTRNNSPPFSVSNLRQTKDMHTILSVMVHH